MPIRCPRFALLAKEKGVSVGAHPGFNDLWGFGRRRIQMKPSDLEYMVAYQIGALQAMAAYAGLKVTHLKAHGALNNMAAEDEGYALAIGRAIRAVDRDIIYVVLSGSQMETAAQKLELRMAREGFPDRKYDDDGNLAPRSISRDSHQGPEGRSESALRMVRDGEVVSDERQARQGAGRYAVRAWRRGDQHHGRQPASASALEEAGHRRGAAGRDDVVAVCERAPVSQQPDDSPMSNSEAKPTIAIIGGTGLLGLRPGAPAGGGGLPARARLA